MLCAVMHCQQRQIDDMTVLVNVAEAAAIDRIGSNARETFRNVA
jgi:hypothetical protein